MFVELVVTDVAKHWVICTSCYVVIIGCTRISHVKIILCAVSYKPDKDVRSSAVVNKCWHNAEPADRWHHCVSLCSKQHA